MCSVQCEHTKLRAVKRFEWERERRRWEKNDKQRIKTNNNWVRLIYNIQQFMWISPIYIYFLTHTIDASLRQYCNQYGILKKTIRIVEKSVFVCVNSFNFPKPTLHKDCTLEIFIHILFRFVLFWSHKIIGKLLAFVYLYPF